MSNFEEAFATLLENEGGYSNNPQDPGGETMWGITARVARSHGYTGDMKELPKQTASDIAKAEYWEPYQLDQLPYQIAFQLFDTIYNGGHAVQWLQQALGIDVDGKMGPLTIKAAQDSEVEKIVLRFNSLRLRYYTSISTWQYFGKGWVNRIADNLWRATK